MAPTDHEEFTRKKESIKFYLLPTMEKSSKNKLFSQQGGREMIARMFIEDELPLWMVECEGFKKLLGYLQDKFVMPSYRTVARDIEKIYMTQKRQLQEELTKTSQRVSLTTDIWTSVQNKSYMMLTAHYIDVDWRLQKKIINFCEIDNHIGETIGRSIEKCLLEWRIEKVLTITVDNAPSNDVGIAYFVRSLRNCNDLVLDGEHIHIQCLVHIINLIVCDGLKEYQESIVRIRNAVKYVKSSTHRLRQFKRCIDNVNITFKENVTLDVPTRWNSTYMMLDNAEKYAVAFDKLHDSDTNYAAVMLEDGHPSIYDWENIREFCKFLKVFYNIILTVSKSLSITTYQYVTEVCNLKLIIQQYADDDSLLLMKMAHGMQSKFDKYWGKFDNINSLIYVSILLDPRFKSKFLKHCLSILFRNDEVDDLLTKSESVLHRLYLAYRNDSSDDVQIVGVTNAQNKSRDMDNIFAEFFNETSTNMSEVEEYLSDRPEKFTSTFDLLSWWKLMSCKYPVLNRIAKDVFMIPISTVPSELAFSCGGRIIDSSRSSLLPNILEAIICSQSWLQSTTSSDTLESQNEYATIEDELAATFNKDENI